MKSLSLVFYSLLVCFISGVAAEKGAKFEKYGVKKYFYACNYELMLAATFCKKGRDYACMCTNENYLATFAGCLAYKNRNSTSVTNRMVEQCMEYGNVTIEEDWSSEYYKYYLDHAKYATEIEGFNKSIPVDVPIKLKEAEMDLFQRSYNQFLGNYDDSLYYGASALGYWLLIMLIGATSNWIKVMFPGLVKKCTSGPVNWWRKHVSMPATFGKKRAQEQGLFKFFDFLIPSRFESVVIFMFYVVIIILCAINTEYIEGDPVFDSKYESTMRYAADRTGIVATIMMPLIFLFAGRNNFLQWLTGWNYNTFMTYHRHTARVMFMLVVIHAVCFSILLSSRYASDMKETYLIWGTIATVAGGIIWVQAMLFFRRRWYEIFLFIHIVMAVLWVAGAWVHVDELGYIEFVYPTVAVWCVDRLVRIGRLIVFGFPKAEVTLLANETLRVVVPKPSYWKSVPGGHAFIHFIKPTYFWQSHPFTFVDSPDNSHIILYCKVKGGLTHSLYRKLVNNPGQTATIRVGVEGPYGESTPAKYADTAVFIAGGNGIPGIYSEIMDIARRVTCETKKKLKLIWVIREYKSLEWFAEELEILKNTTIETTIYVTKPE
ncbi:CFL1 Probable ferric reductase transmembrane component [Candida maltosa Xu316]